MPRATNRAADPGFEIVPEIRSLLDNQTDEEIAILRQQLQDAGGALQPMTVAQLDDGRRILLDGHTRLRLTQELGLPTPAQIHIPLNDLSACRLWVIAHQLGRRNLSDVQRRHYLGLYYLEQEGVIRGGRTADRENALERVARETGTSESTVSRAARRVRNIQTATADNPEVRRRIMVGDVALTDGQARQWAGADETRRASITQMIAAGSTFDQAWTGSTPVQAAPRPPATPPRRGAVTPTAQRMDPAQVNQIVQDGIAMTRQWVQGARRLRSELETLTIVPSGLTLGSIHSELDGLLERVISEVKNRQPAGHCPTCEGTAQSDNGGMCTACNGRGWLDVQGMSIRQRNAS